MDLNNGLKMPMVGYGTFLAKPEEEKILHDCIVYAIVEWGYRHIDTAKVYKNEHIIGEALKECFEKGIKREDLFITTKLWRDDYYDVEAGIKTSLEKLQLDYVDLYLIHWMCTDVDWENCVVKGPPLHDVWKEMEGLVEKGLTKSIGVSNCSVMMLIENLAGAKIKPVTNQIENNPYLSQVELVAFFKKFGVTTTAYAPMGASGWTGNNLLDDETLKEIAEKHNATPAQIALAWNLSRGIAVIPKSVTKERIKANFEAQNIKLDEEDIERINGLNINRRNFDPEKWNEFDWLYTPIFR